MAVWAIANGLDCHTCPAVLQNARGCNTPRKTAQNIEGFLIYDCPNKYKTGAITEYIRAYFHYKNGYLPNAGGWYDQPMKFDAVVSLIDRLMDKFTNKEKPNG